MSLDILNATYFEIFDIPASFECDVDEIQQRYRDLQKAVHPDKFVNSSDQEKRISMQHTSRINEAFNTLKDPVERALYLLSLKGLDINFDNETTMDAAFLMEQMELRESMDEVGDDETALDKLDEMSRGVKNKLFALMESFSSLYESDDTEQARELIRKMQFLQKAQREIAERSAAIEDGLLG